METVHTLADLQKYVSKIKAQNKTIGLVPTMGALHAGHLSLVQSAVNENDVCVVSIFVNPTQFNSPEDLKKYPRTLERDAALLEKAGCHLIFNPLTEDVYSKKDLKKTFEFDFGGLDTMMEGAFRPGHFNGVVQIVSKLFALIQPDRAYFGEKDFQQLAIIHRMVKLMNFEVQIVDCPIVREPGGLAMSSRNERLSPEERNIAANIFNILNENANFAPGKSPRALAESIACKINKVSGLRVEYVEIVEQKTLKIAENWENPAVVCVAVFCGKVRLIDNLKIDVQ
ncbi:MAG: pantoate--beta-alanine ligase [Prevotellaceae bacterium]|jgi:pantoate--beta-alanine ligase|nr:pantoate--beta-alanine ligase [Prevotellaceae bacterium]